MSEGAGIRTWWIAGSAAAVVLVLVAVALNRDPVQLDPSSPEGTVQLYLQAISDGDYKEAFSLLHPDDSEGCDAADLAVAAQTDPFTATLGAAEIVDDIAFVDVSINEGSSPGPFDAGGGGYSELFVLEEVEGQWLITGEPWPYFKWRCEEPA
ncbi:MAG: hypothetical protein IH943_00030 [Acidobacteria bacterium]|nr:hypothetical protein [Acidobacteriota bacterium]